MSRGTPGAILTKHLFGEEQAGLLHKDGLSLCPEASWTCD